MVRWVFVVVLVHLLGSEAHHSPTLRTHRETRSDHLEKLRRQDDQIEKRDLETERYYHAGSDLEVLRQKLEATNLSDVIKEGYNANLLHLEGVLSQLAANNDLSSTLKSELLKELKTNIGLVKALTHDINSASNHDLESEVDQTSLHKTLEYVQAIKNKVGEHVSTRDRNNIDAIINDVDLLESSTRSEDISDLQSAIAMRLPLVQKLMSQINVWETTSHTLSQKLADSAVSRDLYQATDDQATDAGKRSTVANPRGLIHLHDLEQVISKAKLPDEKRTHFINNLQGLDKDERALSDTGLSTEQRADLEVAINLRLTMLSDMQQYLNKLSLS